MVRTLTAAPDMFERFDATRDFSEKPVRARCCAPYTSIYFDTRGNVLSNRTQLGPPNGVRPRKWTKKAF